MSPFYSGGTRSRRGINVTAVVPQALCRQREVGEAEQKPRHLPALHQRHECHVWTRAVRAVEPRIGQHGANPGELRIP